MNPTDEPTTRQTAFLLLVCVLLGLCLEGAAALTIAVQARMATRGLQDENEALRLRMHRLESGRAHTDDKLEVVAGMLEGCECANEPLFASDEEFEATADALLAIYEKQIAELEDEP